MTRKLTVFIIFALINCISAKLFSQESKFEQLSLTKKSTQEFSLDYKISRPRLELHSWDNDFDIYLGYLTPTLRKTQASLSANDHGVIVTMIPNAIAPHAQLDTNTIVSDPQKLIGTWRMLKFRSIRFNDSAYIPTLTYHRLPDTLLDDKSNDEGFTVFTDDNFKLYAREVGKNKFKRMVSSKYKVENRRYLMLYKFSKASAGVLQFGMDEKGYLILNYPKVIENVKKGEYISYYAIIEQYIFEKVSEE